MVTSQMAQQQYRSLSYLLSHFLLWHFLLHLPTRLLVTDRLFFLLPLFLSGTLVHNLCVLTFRKIAWPMTFLGEMGESELTGFSDDSGLTCHRWSVVCDSLCHSLSLFLGYPPNIFLLFSLSSIVVVGFTALAHQMKKPEERNRKDVVAGQTFCLIGSLTYLLPSCLSLDCGTR